VEHTRLLEIKTLLDSKAWYALAHVLAEEHPADIAELVGELGFDEEVVIFRLLGKRRGDVFAYLGPEHQRRILRETRPEQLARIVGQMTPDDRTRVLESLPPPVTHALLGRLPPSDMKESLVLLGYPENTAGRYMTPDYVALDPEMTAGEALAHIRQVGRAKETLNVVYIVDADGRLVEDVRLGSLVLADPETRVTAIVDPGLVSLQDTIPREEVLRMFEKYDRVALPVTDADHRMLGIITVDDVLDVAEEEATKDIQMMGGVEALEAPYAQVAFGSLLRKRAGWLSALFLGEMLTATAMGYYETEIGRAVILALFVPLIISSGGNSGSQAASLIIRALALKELTLSDWVRVFRRELLSGLALGTALGAIGFARVVLWQGLHLIDYGPHYVAVALTVWISLIGVVCFGTLSGSMLPFLMRRLGFDPATSSAPFVATLADVTGLVIYFQVALLILRGRLL
jgi:magnesium transporter